MTASTVYLLRHGRTALNAAGSLRGRLDVPLDEVGHGQAEALADLLRAVPLALIVTSPLIRCRVTAAAVAAATGTPLRDDVRFADRDYGPWAGQPVEAVRDRFGSIEGAPGIEPVESLRSRVVDAFLKAVDASDGPLAIVGHDAVNRCLLGAVCGLDPETIGQRPGCWNRLERDSHRVWTATVVDGLPGDATWSDAPPPIG